MYTDWVGSTEGQTWIKPRWPETVVRGLFSFRAQGFSQAPYGSLNVGLHVGDDPETVLANRHLCASELGGSVDDWVVGTQVHGAKVAVVEDLSLDRQPGGSTVPGVDGLVTGFSGRTLVVLAADCVPMLFFDPVQRVIATAHSGWKGTVGHVSAQVIEVMKNRFHSVPADIEVWLGPSIRQCCYEVDDRVGDEIKREFGPTHLWKRGTQGKYLLNLQSCIRQDLLAQGVTRQHIQDSGVCTASHTNQLFSHRAENGQTGRLLGAIRLV